VEAVRVSERRFIKYTRRREQVYFSNVNDPCKEFSGDYDNVLVVLASP